MGRLQNVHRGIQLGRRRRWRRRPSRGSCTDFYLCGRSIPPVRFIPPRTEIYCKSVPGTWALHTQTCFAAGAPYPKPGAPYPSCRALYTHSARSIPILPRALYPQRALQTHDSRCRSFVRGRPQETPTRLHGDERQLGTGLCKGQG
eukprot:SAG11_NODE_5168_length_1641_cov_2.241245_1_plen_146_part_00